MILNPCLDHPEEHLDFRADGVVLPRTERGRASIEVYGLMRPELVMDRRHVARIIEFRMDLLVRLTELRDALRERQVDEELVLVVEELMMLVFRELEVMADASRPYAGMARQLIAEVAAPNVL